MTDDFIDIQPISYSESHEKELRYIQEKLFKALVIPKEYLGYSEPSGKPRKIFLINVLNCECGAEKCKTTHSDWCPKYKK